MRYDRVGQAGQVGPPQEGDYLFGAVPVSGDSANLLIAQADVRIFRPEKDHAKQVHALAKLFESHPEYKSGEAQIKLIMAGGVRDETDEARVEGLRTLARDLGVEVSAERPKPGASLLFPLIPLQSHIEFLVSAPYPEIVKRLGEASIGLHTMQDEHFGINVVEFMVRTKTHVRHVADTMRQAAGLIPVVHASAGPLMDIVVPYNGQQTGAPHSIPTCRIVIDVEIGFLAKTADEFAERLHDALSLSTAQQRKIRDAARAAAEERFSEAVFNEGFGKVYEDLVYKSRNRRR